MFHHFSKYLTFIHTFNPYHGLLSYYYYLHFTGKDVRCRGARQLLEVAVLQDIGHFPEPVSLVFSLQLWGGEEGVLRSTKEREASGVPGEVQTWLKKNTAARVFSHLDQQCPSVTLMVNDHTCYCSDNGTNHYWLYPSLDRSLERWILSEGVCVL